MGVGWRGARAFGSRNQGSKPGKQSTEATRTRAGDAPYRMGNTGGEGKPACLVRGKFCPLDNTPRSLRVLRTRSWRRRTAHHCKGGGGAAWRARRGMSTNSLQKYKLVRRAGRTRHAARRTHTARRARSSHRCGAPQVFIGDQSVGKTSIISRFMYDQFDTHYASTIGACTARAVCS